MIYSSQDWFFRIEFINGTDGGTVVAQTIDDGVATEDHVVVVNADYTADPNVLRRVLVHEFQHAVERFLERRVK